MKDNNYNELIKNAEKMRGLIRDVFVFGYRSRMAFDEKSARSYDNAIRRVKSYFGELVRGERDQSGRRVSIIIDSDSVDSNPLYRLYKTKSFTQNDLVLHFVILDAMQDLREGTPEEIAQYICNHYYDTKGNNVFQIDPYKIEFTLFRKLKEYAELGILLRQEGKKLCYRLSDLFDETVIDREMIHFFSETDVLGVIGSFILDRCSAFVPNVKFKHRQLFAALDSLNLYLLLNAINERSILQITRKSDSDGRNAPETLTREVVPLKILINRQNGRQYVAAFDCKENVFVNFRLDHITEVRFEDGTFDQDKLNRLKDELAERLLHTWNVNYHTNATPQKVELVVRVGEDEGFIVTRLKREGHGGKVEQLSGDTYRYTTSVYDPSEMIPWIKSFIGRIVRFRCEDKMIEEKFFGDLNHMLEDWLNEE